MMLAPCPWQPERASHFSGLHAPPGSTREERDPLLTPVRALCHEDMRPHCSVPSRPSCKGFHKEPSGTLSRKFPIPSPIHFPLRDFRADLCLPGPLRLGVLPPGPGLSPLLPDTALPGLGRCQGHRRRADTGLPYWSFSVPWGWQSGTASEGVQKNHRALSQKGNKPNPLCWPVLFSPASGPIAPTFKVSSRSPSSKSSFPVSDSSFI